MSDAVGIVQFLMALSEIAKGASAPSSNPVWERELLNARNPPKITHHHCEYDDIVPNPNESLIRTDNIVCRSFFFGPDEIFALRTYLPDHLKNKCTRFEVISACVWRCRTAALELDSNQEVRFLCYVNARSRFDPPLPKGYYGNVLATPVARTTARKLTNNPFGYAMELVMKAKSEVTKEYMKSNADQIVLEGRRLNIRLAPTSTFLVSDLTRVGLDEVDFGWGKPLYVGVAVGDLRSATRDIIKINVATTAYVPTRNKQGEKGVLVPVFLPEFAMKRFVQLVEMMVKRIEWKDDDDDDGDHDFFRDVRSAL